MSGQERICLHRIAIRDFMGCDSTVAGKDTIICEFPDWKGKECPFEMLARGLITESEFYELWKKAWVIENQNSG